MARFLKSEVLPLLAQKCEIKMVRQLRVTPLAVDETEKVKKGRDSAFEFVWKVIDPNEVPPPPRFKPKKEVVGEEVGVDMDYGHLNKRRQNARVGKITRDVEAMKSFREAFRHDETTARDPVGRMTRDVGTMKSFRHDFRQDQPTARDRVGRITRDVEAVKPFRHDFRQDQTTARDRFGRITRDVEAMKSFRHDFSQDQTTARDRFGRVTRDVGAIFRQDRTTARDRRR
jgi:hypothetical protein